MSRALDELLALLELEEVDRDCFRGPNESADRPHLFGGQLAAQALAAAGATAPGLPAHSLHIHFLGRGDPRVPVAYHVERMRDAERAATRGVRALQGDRTLATMIASFREPGLGFEHGVAMPPADRPEDLPRLRDGASDDSLPAAAREWMLWEHPIDLRIASGPGLLRGDGRQGPVQLWLRSDGELPEDALLHQCVAAYGSDLGPLETALRRHVHGFVLAGATATSLDHTLWFHRAFRMDRWVLDVLDSPVSAEGRALVRGSLFDAGGRLVASIAQELLIRPAKRAVPTPTRTRG